MFALLDLFASRCWVPEIRLQNKSIKKIWFLIEKTTNSIYHKKCRIGTIKHAGAFFEWFRIIQVCLNHFHTISNQPTIKNQTKTKNEIKKLIFNNSSQLKFTFEIFRSWYHE